MIQGFSESVSQPRRFSPSRGLSGTRLSDDLSPTYGPTWQGSLALARSQMERRARAPAAAAASVRPRGPHGPISSILLSTGKVPCARWSQRESISDLRDSSEVPVRERCKDRIRLCCGGSQPRPLPVSTRSEVARALASAPCIAVSE